MSFRDWPLIWKVASLLLLLGCTSLAGAYYATAQYSVIDELDSAIIDGPAAANTNLARANRFIIMAQSAIYHNIVETRDEGSVVATKELEAATKGVE